MRLLMLLGAFSLTVSGCVRFGVCEDSQDCGAEQTCGPEGFCLPLDAVTDGGGGGQCSIDAPALRDRIPLIGILDPPVWCQGGTDAQVWVEGDNLIDLGDYSSVLLVDGQSFAIDFSSYTAVETLDGAQRYVEGLRTITASDLSGLSLGSLDATIANRDVGGRLCSSSPFKVAVVPLPVVDTATRQLCVQDTALTGFAVGGSDLQHEPDAAETAEIVLESSASGELRFEILSQEGCTSLSSGWLYGCSALLAQVMPSTLPAASYSVTLTQPFDGGCPLSHPAGQLIVVNGPPSLSTLPSTTICSGVAFVVPGSGFQPGLEAFIGTDPGDVDRIDLLVTSVGATEVTLQLPAGETFSGDLPLYLGSGTNCLVETGPITLCP